MPFCKEQYRIILVFVVLFVITGMCLGYMAERTNSDIKESVRNELRTIATVIASDIDGDSQAQLVPGDETTPAFTALRDRLNAIRQANPSLRYIYTMRQNGSAVEFVVDADYGIEPDGARIGQVYPNFTPQLVAGFSQPSAGSDFITDAWGTTLSGYAPIRDSTGQPVGLVAVDMESNRVIARQQSIVTSFILIAILALIIAVCGILAAELIRGSALRELEERKQYLDGLLNGVPAGILVIDGATKKIMDANERAVTLIGRPKEEILGRICHQFICPAEHSRCPITDLGQQIDHAERVLLTPDGRKIPIIKTVRKVTILNREYLVENFIEMPDKK